jgi:hypothetical protein
MLARNLRHLNRIPVKDLYGVVALERLPREILAKATNQYALTVFVVCGPILMPLPTAGSLPLSLGTILSRCTCNHICRGQHGQDSRRCGQGMRSDSGFHRLPCRFLHSDDFVSTEMLLQDELEQMLRHADIATKRIPILFFANKVRGCWMWHHHVVHGPAVLG